MVRPSISMISILTTMESSRTRRPRNHRISHANIVAHLTLHRCVLDNHFCHSSNARFADSSRDWHPGATGH